MRKLPVFFTLLAALFCGGCWSASVVGILGSPVPSEKIIPAEYNLKKHRNQRILVLVNQPSWLNVPVNLRFYLTKAISKSLIKKVKIPAGNLVSYDELSRFRSNRDNFSLLLPVEVGTALNADMVLLVIVEDYQLREMAESGYYKGDLSIRAALFETATWEKLWPESIESKSIKVGFEIESGGRERGISRLVSNATYCLVRYFYNCSKKKFKIADDRSGIGWKDWGK